MCNKCHNELVNALLEIPGIEDFATRTDLLVGIPNSRSLERHKDSARTDLSQTVKALVGLTAKREKKPLKILIDNARLRVEGYILSDRLESLRLQYEQCRSQNEEQANQESTASQQQSLGPAPAASKKKNSASGDKRAKSGPERNSYGSLEDCRKIVAKIESTLDGTPALFFTAAVLNGYAQSLSNVIREVRNASKETAAQCLQSRDAILSNIREARDYLSLALLQLEEKAEKGKNSQYFRLLRSCRTYLEQALKYWQNSGKANESFKQTQPDPQISVTAHTSTPQSVNKEKTMPGFANGYALIIGIARYLNIGRLSESVLQDAVSIHTTLRSADYCGYNKEHIQPLINEEATADGIRDGLRWLAQSAGKSATAIIYFSGHGGRVQIDSQISHYLIPYNCNMEDLDGTAITSEELTQMLHAIQAQRLLCLLDSCYSGGTGEIKVPGGEQTSFKYGPEKDYYEQLAQGTGRVIIASSRSSETSRVLPEMDHSLFTHYLVEALQGKARTDGDGLIRVNDIFGHVSKNVPEHRPQHPVITAKEAENFPIALYLGGKQNTSVDQVALRKAMVDAFSMEDLEELCADIEQALRSKGINLQVNLEIIGGSPGKRSKVLNLIGYLDRNGYLSYLVIAVHKAKPNIVF